MDRNTPRANTALGRFLERVQLGEVEPGSYLVIESLDRLSREAVSDAAYLLLGLIKSGVRVVTLTDKREYSFKVMADQEFKELEGDLSTINTLISVDDEFVENCSKLIQDGTTALQRSRPHILL